MKHTGHSQTTFGRKHVYDNNVTSSMCPLCALQNISHFYRKCNFIMSYIILEVLLILLIFRYNFTILPVDGDLVSKFRRIVVNADFSEQLNYCHLMVTKFINSEGLLVILIF